MIEIRRENENDYDLISNLIHEAFCNSLYKDQAEQISIEQIRKSNNFIPELSLVAQTRSGKLVGYIFLIEISIDEKYPALSLAQIAVLPRYHVLGVGSLLIHNVHKKAKELGYGFVITLGFKDYFSCFGYREIADFNIHLPYGIIENQCMIYELSPGALKEVSGTVVYPAEFFA